MNRNLLGILDGRTEVLAWDVANIYNYTIFETFSDVRTFSEIVWKAWVNHFAAFKII